MCKVTKSVMLALTVMTYVMHFTNGFQDSTSSKSKANIEVFIYIVQH